MAAPDPPGLTEKRTGPTSVHGACKAADLPGSERIELAPPGPESQEDLDGIEASSSPDGKDPTE